MLRCTGSGDLGGKGDCLVGGMRVEIRM